MLRLVEWVSELRTRTGRQVVTCAKGEGATDADVLFSERDACGVGLIARRDGVREHEVISNAINAASVVMNSAAKLPVFRYQIRQMLELIAAAAFHTCPPGSFSAAEVTRPDSMP